MSTSYDAPLSKISVEYTGAMVSEKVDKPGPVLLACESLRSQVDELYATTAKLTSKLAPVLMIESEDETDYGEDPYPVALSPLDDEVLTSTRRVNSVVSDLRRLIDRLTV
jgi:hypothetical protein